MKKVHSGIYVLLALVAAFMAVPLASAVEKPHSRDIVQTPHNLSITGGGGAHDIKSGTEAEVCIFCHAPHHASTVTPLWSREISPLTIYVTYKSPTLKANPQQPRGASRLCLSCHDGTIALGHLTGDRILDASLPAFKDMPQETDPRKNPNLGTDLSNDHPISFLYSDASNLELHDATAVQAKGIRLSQDQSVECTSCHDAHNNQYGNFLVQDVSLQQDALCTTCHNKQGWSDPDSAHRTGGTRYDTVRADVAASGCINCHLPHNAQRGEHLLRLSGVGAGEETNCYASCHRNVPYTNVWSQFNTSLYTHSVQNYNGVHVDNENLPVVAGKKHVECTDCHNPHFAGAQGLPLGSSTTLVQPASAAPDINGALRGVRGVDLTGAAVVSPARYEYEICYRCHAGPSADQFTSLAQMLPNRLFKDYDESNRFNSSNAAYHPVSADRRPGPNGRSLRSQYQSTMFRIYCNDCHDSHGTNEPHMMRYLNQDTFPATGGTNYPLCFRCHDPDYLLNPAGAPRSDTAVLHQRHVLGQHLNGDTRQTPCSVCHDPHGVPASRGALFNNAAHMVNFDIRYAGETAAYDALAKTCTVTCHTSNPKSYP